jgi:hypothetical protein
MKAIWKHCESIVKALWKHYESIMKALWKHFEITVKALWKRCESIMKALRLGDTLIDSQVFDFVLNPLGYTSKGEQVTTTRRG